MKDNNSVPSKGIFSKTDNFLNLSEVARDFPFTNDLLIDSEEHFYSLLNEINAETQSIPMFLKDNGGHIHIIAALNKSVKIEQGNTRYILVKNCIKRHTRFKLRKEEFYMKQKIRTSLAYTKNLFVTGALTQTSRNVEVEICRYVPKEEGKTIIEFGMGHGNITREILNNMAPNSKLYAFDVKKSFCDYVRKTISDNRLIIINDGAENLKKHIKGDVDAVIASIPFSFFSKEKGLGIIQDAHDVLTNDSYYSQVLYTKFNFKKFQQIFDKCYMKSFKGTITEYVYHCKKIKG